jgi:hypothetical protein
MRSFGRPSAAAVAAASALSSNDDPGKAAENERSPLCPVAASRHAIVPESTPPDRNRPSGRSATRRNSIASSSSAPQSGTADGRGDQ